MPIRGAKRQCCRPSRSGASTYLGRAASHMREAASKRLRTWEMRRTGRISARQREQECNTDRVCTRREKVSRVQDCGKGAAHGTWWTGRCEAFAAGSAPPLLSGPLAAMGCRTAGRAAGDTVARGPAGGVPGRSAVSSGRGRPTVSGRSGCWPPGRAGPPGHCGGAGVSGSGGCGCATCSRNAGGDGGWDGSAGGGPAPERALECSDVRRRFGGGACVPVCTAPADAAPAAAVPMSGSPAGAPVLKGWPAACHIKNTYNLYFSHPCNNSEMSAVN